MKKMIIRSDEILVSDSDYYKVVKYNWRKDRHGYMITDMTINKKRRSVLMHRFILEAPKGYVVDHIDGNKLDNRRENLRLCTRSQNSRNKNKKNTSKSQFKGVYLKTDQFRKKPWQAYISKYPGSHELIGYFKTETEAAVAYNIKAVQYHGEFAKLNMI